MKLKLIGTLMLILVFISCSDQPDTPELTSPGFGVVESVIDARPEGVDIPILMKSEDIIKGIQFTLVWDVKKGIVGKPLLTDANASFTLTSSNPSNGRIKVLIYSMSGDQLDLSDPQILTFPVSIIDQSVTDFTVIFENPIFAGPSASSYTIPVTHAKMKVKHS